MAFDDDLIDSPAPEAPQWVLDDQANIALIESKAQEARDLAASQGSEYHRARLLAEADVHDQDADLARRLLEARVNRDEDARIAVSLEYRAFRAHWRGIRDLRRTGELHIFAAEAAERGN